MSSLAKLPAKAAYLTINNPARRNALSLEVLRSLKSQLLSYMTSPADGRTYFLPTFKPGVLTSLEKVSGHLHSAEPSSSRPNKFNDVAWLLSATHWNTHRAGLPNVLVLRSSDDNCPVFSAGHDLRELASLSHNEVKEAFSLCSQVMALIRRFPGLVLGRIHGLATAAGAQVAMSADVPIAQRGTSINLPGATLGLPCTSPVTAVSRRVGNARAYRMKMLAEPVLVEELGDAVDVVEQGALDQRIEQLVRRLTEDMAGQPMALSKWAFWTQTLLNGAAETGKGGDGYEDALGWTKRIMPLHARTEDAREGMKAFLEKRKPVWKT